VNRKEANSIDYYGLAILYFVRRDARTASTFARRAIDLNERDRLLTKEAYEACKRIAEQTVTR